MRERANNGNVIDLRVGGNSISKHDLLSPGVIGLGSNEEAEGTAGWGGG